MATSSTTVMYRLVARDQGTPGMRKFGRSVDKTTEKTERLNRSLGKLDRRTVRAKVKVDFDEQLFLRQSAKLGEKASGLVLGPFEIVRQRIPVLLVAAVAAAIPLLPAVGAAAAGAIVTGFGVGLAGLAVVGALQNKQLRKEFKQTAKAIVKDFRGITGPVENVLFWLTDQMRKTWRRIAPDLQRAIEDVAPGLREMLRGVLRSVEALVPALEPMAEAFTKVWKAVGPRLPRAVGRIADALIRIARTVQDNPKLFGDFVIELIDIGTHALRFVDRLARLADKLEKFPDLSRGAAKAFGVLGDAIEAAFTFSTKHFDDVVGFFRGLTTSSKEVTDKLPSGKTVRVGFDFVPTTKAERAGAAIRDMLTGGQGGLLGGLFDDLQKSLDKVPWAKIVDKVGVKIASAAEKSTRISSAFTTALTAIMLRVNWNQVVEAILAGMVLGFLRGTGLWDLGGTIAEKIKAGLQNKWVQLVLDATSWLGPSLVDLGAAIVDGLINGFKNKWVDKFFEIVAPIKWFIRWFKDIFGIASPSSLFFGFGADIVQGLINGLLSKLPFLRDTSSSLGSAIRNRFKGSGGWLVGRGKSIVQGLISGMNSKRGDLNKATSASVSGMLGRWNRLRGGTRATAAYVVNSVMGRLVRAYNKLAKAFSGKTAPAPRFAGGGQVQTQGPDPRQLAAGGQIRGAGTGTSDSILARVSNGEYIVNARQTRKHLDLLRAINAGADGFANGGLVGGIPWDIDPQKYMRAQNARILASLNQLGGSAWEKTLRRIPHIVAGMLVKAAKKLGFAGNIGGAMRFAKAQDGKPYIWGGVGPRGYDCSGFMSAIVNVLQGKFPYSRRFTTGSFAGGRGVAGFQRGARSAFMIGVNPFSHMAGTFIAGGRRIPVESGGRGGGVNFGPPADGAFGRSWSHHFGLRKFKPSSGGPPGLEGVFNARGGFIKPGQLSVVGENGPEIVMGGFRGGGAVLSNRSSRLLARQGHIRLGQVSMREWDALLAAGYRGDPTDRMEALYAPRRRSQDDVRRVLRSMRQQAARRGDREPVVIEFHSGGSAADDLLLQWARKTVRVRGGGDVQVAFGQGGRR